MPDTTLPQHFDMGRQTAEGLFIADRATGDRRIRTGGDMANVAMGFLNYLALMAPRDLQAFMTAGHIATPDQQAAFLHTIGQRCLVAAEYAAKRTEPAPNIPVSQHGAQPAVPSAPSIVGGTAPLIREA